MESHAILNAGSWNGNRLTYTLILTIIIQYYSNKKWNENQFLQVVLKNQIKTKNKLTGRLLSLSDPSSRGFDCDN